MTYEEFKQNFLPEFLKIKSFNGKMKYASQYLQRIGSGSGRIVYDIDGEKVLKLAKNPKGVAQNTEEASMGRDSYIDNIVTNVFESADDDTWLIAEKAKKVNEKRIKELTGIPSLSELYYYLRNFSDVNNGRRSTFHVEPDVKELLDNNEFAQNLMDVVANYNQSAGDMGRPSSYGEVLHDGQPAIVLTDYGLSDEVYDTHYSGKQKQRGYRMYEMYNFADGNDDILSDMPGQDGIDTRQAMWGLMPYGVGDGPGVINEKFVSFVENHDKYPTSKVLPSTPYILDEFHDIVNNLREVLDHVKDKKKFYNNLLELQDYLIRGKFWDREPLEKEMLSESPVSISKLSDAESDKIANELSAKLFLGKPQPLGPGGGNGKAYSINGNKVLKITVDPCEVFAGAKTNAAHPKTLVFTHKIYKAIDTETNIEVYVLINDYIADKPYEEFERYKTLISSLDTSGENAMFENLLTILVRGKSKVPQFSGKTLQDFPELAKLILTNKPEANITQEDRQKAYQYMMGLYAIRTELLQLGIKSTDFYVSSNLGYKDGVLTFFDIGGCIVPELNIPPDAIIRLPEGEEMLNEEVGGFPKDIADRVANTVAQKFNYGTPQHIGDGIYGYAYDIGNNLVLKVTKDQSEANENLELIGKPLEYIAQPYKVFSVKSDSITKAIDKQLYVIILEKLKTDTANFTARVERMKFAFEKIMGANYADVLDHYIHGPQPYDDVDEQKVEKYFARNPQDKEFFDKILKIGEEVKKYGLESTDYTNPKNLGYKPNGNLGFFDVGFGNYYFKSGNKPEVVQVDEDGSALYATDNSFGQDNFPVHNNMDTSPMIDPNIPTTVDEDLEYNHVVGDATQDEFQITERKLSSMDGSSTVEVKKKCRLAGNGNTSTACNQGDISNLNIKPLDEAVIPYNKTFWGWVSPKNQITQVPKYKHSPFIEAKYPDIHDSDDVFDKAFEDGWVRVIYEYEPQDFMGKLSLNGHDLNRLKAVLRDVFYDMIKYGNNWVFMQYMYPEGPGNYKSIYTGDSDGKAKLVNFVNEEIDAKDLYGDDTDDVALKTVINGKRDVCFIKMNPTNAKIIEKNGLGVFPVRMTSQNTMMAIIYRNKDKAQRLLDIAKSHGGYLSDKTPDEAREIGRLLGYKEESIEEYIRRNQHRYGRQIPRAPEPEDFNDIDESKKNAIFAENTEMNEAEIMSIQNLPFRQEVEQLGGQIYAVGGSVRDSFLGLGSKDLDIIIRGIPEDQLVQILGKYGTVNPVGKSFAVMKFKPQGSTEDIDIALPRTEISTGEGHKDFIITPDHTLPIEKDLERRDFTINAIAKDMEGNVIDPFNGREDLNSKVIRITHPKSFSDDPLRMLRAVQFASRFGGFEIEPQTYQMIKDNAKMIRTVAKDRVQEEFQKIIEKGDPAKGAFLLKDTGLLREMGVDAPLLVGNAWDNVNTLAEYIYLLAHNSGMSPLNFYKRNFRGDTDIINEIIGLMTGMDAPVTDSPVANRAIAHNMVVNSKSTKALESKLLPPKLQVAAQELLSGKYPKTVDEMAANGDDLKQIGYVEGKELGAMKKAMLLKIYSDEIPNNKEALLDFAKQRNPGDVSTIKEEMSEKVEYGTLLLFLNVPIWERITSIIFPEDIYDEPEYGIEKEPHVTVLYGFKDEVTADEVFGLVRETIPMQPIKIGLKGISVFTNPRFDVVKFDVNSPELVKLHDVVKQLPNKESFPDYHPHITIAYVKPGTGEKYIKAFEKERIITGSELIFSTKGHRGREGEILALSESLADKAAERMFGISNPSAEQDVQAAGAVQAQEEQPVAFVSGADRKKTAIYENPSSLANFGPNVRGIIDHEGDIFIAQRDGNFNHGRMGLALGFMESDTDAMYKHLTEYMLINRIENSNAFGLADSSADFAEDEFDYDNLKIVTDFLRAAKRRNPQYEFYNEYYEQIKGKPIEEQSIYPRMHPEEQNPTWNVNGQEVDVNFFADQYYQWNQGGYDYASDKSVLEFLQNNYEDFSNDERLKHDLYHKLVDNEVLDEEEMKRNVRYTAVVLDDKSRSALLERLGNMIPDGWETIAHHMTMNLGPIAPEYVKFLGMTIVMEATEFSMDDKVMAVGVEVDKYLSKNKKPHITLAVNRANGGKPMMSNQLTDWEKLSEPLILTGKVTEVE